MPDNHSYKLPKALQQVTLWVHAEGCVVGFLFLSLHTKNSLNAEDPAAVINAAAPFLVLQRTAPDELRFYHKKAITRLEYQEKEVTPQEGLTTLPCHMVLLDGSHLEGIVKCVLPPDHARLYDYLNLVDEAFVKLYLDNHHVCLVNKSSIVYVAPATVQARATPDDLSATVEIDEMSG